MPIPCCSHTVPLPCRSTKALECVFPIWFTQCDRVWFTHAMPFPCHATNMPFWKRPLKAMAGSWHVRGRVAAAGWRYVGDLPLLVPGSLLSEAYQSQMQWPAWKRALSENSRVVAGSRQGNGMVCVNWSLKRQGNGMGTAWERHGMCESAFIVPRKAFPRIRTISHVMVRWV
jgi:hypothetical protein